MTHGKLIRHETGPEGTFGKLYDEDGELVCHTVELTWRRNARNVSCIPAGTYPIRRRAEGESSRFPYEHFAVDKVPERSAILIHRANWGGQRARGLQCDLHGCIGPGVSQEPLGGQMAVKSSRVALEKLLKHDLTQLTIEWADGVAPEDDI